MGYLKQEFLSGIAKEEVEVTIQRIKKNKSKEKKENDKQK
jgi:hypothetical protein